MSIQSSPLSANSRWIWPFEILEQIGEGGMGVVYRARYVVNGRNVALKMLPGDVTDKTALARFERELEVLKTLKHPNIVRCFGGVCEDKRRFYAMELVEGGNLDEKLQHKGRLAWEQVIYYGLQMCAALECSHEKGVVHRDIKPSNFLLTTTGQLKLSDFGLASVMAARKITAAGKTAGTFLYMAPEQIRGHEVTPRTDLYALGCVLYELVTGEPPFVGDTPGATLHLHCYTPAPRPTQKSLDCPAALEQIILRLMNKEAAARPESAVAVAKELRAVSQTVTVVSPRRELMTDFGDTPEEPPRHVPVQLDHATAKNIPALHTADRTTTWLLGGLLALSVLLNLMFWWGGRQGAWHTAWMEAARSPVPEVRVSAAEAFGKLVSQDSSALEPLVAGLEDPDPRVRVASANGLGQAGKLSIAVNGALVKAQKNDDKEEVRQAAERAMGLIKQDQGSRTSLKSLMIWSVLGLGIALVSFFGYRRLQGA